MKNYRYTWGKYFLLPGIVSVLLIGLSTPVFAQDEAVIAVKARLDRSSSFHFNLGAATSLGQNNYRGGTQVGLGYQKRINRILSLGGNVSYATFRSDYVDYMTGRYQDQVWNNQQPNNFYYTPNQAQYYLVNLSGGDLKQTSIGALVKINFVPIKSNTVASFYALAAPSLVISNLEEVESNINFFEHPTVTQYNQVNNQSFISAEKESTVTGGIQLAAGVEFFPVNVFSFYIQAGLGYTFPVPFVDTSLYEKRVLEKSYYNPFVDYPLSADYPLSTDKGFTALNVQLGLAYNF